MEFESYSSQPHLSIDSLLEGMDNKEQAAAYINHIYASITDEVFIILSITLVLYLFT